MRACDYGSLSVAIDSIKLLRVPNTKIFIERKKSVKMLVGTLTTRLVTKSSFAASFCRYIIDLATSGPMSTN